MEHITIPLGEIHKPHNWEFASEVDRLAAAGFASEDVGSIALQLDNGVYWRLDSISPVLWLQVAAKPDHTHVPSAIVQDATNRFVTDAEKTTWNAKQPAGNYATGGGTATGTNTGDQVLPTTLPASDVYAWAKSATKPTYTAAEVGLGNVPNLSFSGSNTGDETTASIKTKLGITTLSGANTGDQTIPTTLPASDVYAWAKAATKPTYTKSEVGLDQVDNTSNATERAAAATLTNKTINLASNTLVATSLQLKTAVTDETGSGSLVFATSPTLVTPALGTPASGALDNCTTNTEAAGSNSTQLASTAHVFAERSNTATLTNKTLTSPVIATPTLSTEALVVTTNNYPTIRPSLNLDFANSQTVDPRITYTGNSSKMRTNSKGLLELMPANVPRIDYDPVTLECKGLLIEESRTNLLTYSEQFDNAIWLKNNATITPNATTAPNGTLTADKGAEDTAAEITHRPFKRNYTASPATSYTVSVYVKAAERSAFMLLLSDGAGNFFSADFDLSGVTSTTRSNSIPGASHKIEPVANGWFRCSISYFDTAGGASSYFDLRLSRAAASATSTGDAYTGNGTSGLYIWGAQLEAGSFPTSYIPTTTAAVTRAADVAVMTGANFSSWFNSSEGAFAVKNVAGGTRISQEILYAGDGASSAEFIALRYSSGSQLGLSVNDGGTNQASLAAPGYSTSGSTYSVAAAYKQDAFACSINGASAMTDVSGTLPTVTQLNIGAHHTGNNIINGHIKSLSYYPQRLTNAQLQALSTQ